VSAADDPEARVFSPAAALMLVVVGVFAFAALVVLFAYAPDLRSADNGDAHALSKSAVGYAGIVEALKLAGEPVLVNRAPLPPRAGAGLLVVTPTMMTTEAAVRALRFGGPVLVVLPKWLAAPDPLHRGWVAKAALIDPRWPPKTALMATGTLARRRGPSRPVLHGVSPPFRPGDVFAEGPVQSLQSFTIAGYRPMLADETGATILSMDPSRQIYLLSDPDLINTQGLKNLDTLGSALAILRLLKAGDGPVIFDVRLNGFAKERSLLRLLFDPPFLGATLCLAVAAALAGFQAACRFGPPRRTGRTFALGKAALVDNSAALIRLAGREPRMGGRYAQMTRDFAARAVGAPRELTGEALGAFLDRLSAGRGARDTLGRLTALAETVTDRAGLIAAARRLFRWRLEMTRERQ